MGLRWAVWGVGVGLRYCDSGSRYKNFLVTEPSLVSIPFGSPA